jgi:hypothetical protein
MRRAERAATTFDGIRMKIQRGRAGALVGALLLALGAGACSDNNPWEPQRPDPGGGGGNGGADATPPSVDILFPNEETGTVAVGDSLFVRVRVRDGVGVQSVRLEGFALRGDPDLGNQVRVDRFGTKTVEFSTALPRDTTIARYLIATSDSLPETGVLVVVSAVDAAGNAGADTFHVAVGGPRVSIVEPAASLEPRGGTQVRVRVTAEDPVDLITSLRIRASGAFAADVPISFPGAVSSADTAIVLAIPAAAEGTLRLDASVTSGTNRTANAVPVTITIRPAEADAQPPRTTFTTAMPPRMEHGDRFQVSVSATDETRVDSVGVTVLALRRTSVGRDTLAVLHGRRAGDDATFDFGLATLGLNVRDTATVEFEVTAWARDPFNNCGAATTPGTPQSLACAPGPDGSRLSTGAGRLEVVFVARGTTVLRPNPNDVIADLVADSTHVFLSNFSRNRVEVLPIGSTTYGPAVTVGSQPWGLALGRTRDTLFVANSGGTNISAVPVRTGLPFMEDQGARIFTPNEVLYEVRFDANTMVPSDGFIHDYSDRPQYIAQTSLGQLIYSTRPTGAAPDGTIQIYDPRKQNQEIFTGYVRENDPSGAIVVNARSAAIIAGTPKLLQVCVRRRRSDVTDPPCFSGRVDEVALQVDSMRNLPPDAFGTRYDTRVDVFANILDVGLSDTTFVAVSGDRSTVAFGEGARERGRIPVFTVQGEDLVLTGNIYDLINNADERVIGLGMNYDGSLGVARGFGTYYFTRQARLQGTTPATTPAGGVAMHPENANYPSSPTNRLSFVSGITDGGAPYVDVFNTFNFLPVRRIFIRDPVVGAIAVAPRGPGDPANVVHRLYAITSGGILALEVLATDLN